MKIHPRGIGKLRDAQVVFPISRPAFGNFGRERPDERFIPNRPSLSVLRLNVETRLRRFDEAVVIGGGFDRTGANRLAHARKRCRVLTPRVRRCGHCLRPARNCQPVGTRSEPRRATLLARRRRLPILVSLVWESGSEPPETLPAPPGTTAPAGTRYPNLPADTDAAYGYKEGLPRLLDLLQRNQIHATAFICAKSTEAAPAFAREIAQRGHECAAHGYTHDAQYQLSRDDERTFISNASDLIARMTGQHPWVGTAAVNSAASTPPRSARARVPLPHRRLQPRRTVRRVGQRQAVCGRPYTTTTNDVRYFRRYRCAARGIRASTQRRVRPALRRSGTPPALHERHRPRRSRRSRGAHPGLPASSPMPSDTRAWSSCAPATSRAGRSPARSRCTKPTQPKAAAESAGLAPDIARDIDDELQLRPLIGRCYDVPFVRAREAALRAQREVPSGM